jgi:hypothetical protein
VKALALKAASAFSGIPEAADTWSPGNFRAKFADH